MVMEKVWLKKFKAKLEQNIIFVLMGYMLFFENQGL